MDAGAVGSLVADFPSSYLPPGETRIVKTADYLLDHSCFEGGFFQNMIHCGINRLPHASIWRRFACGPGTRGRWI